MGKNADGGPFGPTQAMNSQDSLVLIVGLFQSPTGAKNGHNDNPLAKIRLIAQTKLAGGPPFRRGRWSELLCGLFGFNRGRFRGVSRPTVTLVMGIIGWKKKILKILEGDVSPYSLIQPSNGQGEPRQK